MGFHIFDFLSKSVAVTLIRRFMFLLCGDIGLDVWAAFS